jgi:hypothetical protein
VRPGHLSDRATAFPVGRTGRLQGRGRSDVDPPHVGVATAASGLRRGNAEVIARMVE